VGAGPGAISRSDGNATDAEPQDRYGGLEESFASTDSLVATSINGTAIDPPIACIEASSGDTLTIDVSGCSDDSGGLLGTVVLHLSDTATGTYRFCMDPVDEVSSGARADCGCLTIVVFPLFGDVDETGVVDLDDVLCAFRCFESSRAECAEADITPCGGDGACDVADILAVLANFGDG
jgi:hypothetical protein